MEEVPRTGDIGVVGVSAGGEELLLKLSAQGLVVIAYDWNPENVDEILVTHSCNNIISAHTLEYFMAKIKIPRKIMMYEESVIYFEDRITMVTSLMNKGDTIQVFRGSTTSQSTVIKNSELIVLGPDTYIYPGKSEAHSNALTGSSTSFGSLFSSPAPRAKGLLSDRKESPRHIKRARRQTCMFPNLEVGKKLRTEELSPMLKRMELEKEKFEKDATSWEAVCAMRGSELDRERTARVLADEKLKEIRMENCHLKQQLKREQEINQGNTFRLAFS